MTPPPAISVPSMANDSPPQAPRAAISMWPFVWILAVLFVIGGGVWTYQNGEINQETYKALIVDAGPWCGGGQLLRRHLVSDNKITRAEAEEIRQALTTLKERNTKCIDPAPEPVVKVKGKKK